MFNDKDILARLQAGEDAQTIADEMTKALNEAINQKKAEDARIKAEEEARIQVNVQKVEELQSILDLLRDWFKTYTIFTEVDEVFAELPAEEVIEVIEAYGECAKAIKSFGIKPTLKRRKTPVPASTDPDMVIKDFLKEIGL